MRTIGSRRRSAFSASRCLVSSFSRASSCLRAASHSSRDTTWGRLIANLRVIVRSAGFGSSPRRRTGTGRDGHLRQTRRTSSRKLIGASPGSLGRMTASRTGSVLEQEPGSRYPAGLVAVSVAASGWALLYALYRGYYGLGGTIGMIGTPASPAEFRALN